MLEALRAKPTGRPEIAPASGNRTSGAVAERPVTPRKIKPRSAFNIPGILLWSALSALFLGVLALLFSAAMTETLNHDENQFIAAGKLLATQGLLPYRDYPFFHTPLLVWINAGLFRLTDYLLLSARTVSVTCAGATLLVFFALAWRSSRRFATAQRIFLSVGITALIVANPSFIVAFPRAWNQTPPMLLLLLACLLHEAAGEKQSRSCFFGSGFLVALAVGTRLSYAPFVLPFLLRSCLKMAVEPGVSSSQRKRHFVFHSLGLLVGVLLVFAPVLRNYEAIWYGNFVYNGALNSAYLGTRGDFLPALGGKIIFLGKWLTTLPTGSFMVAFFLLAVVPFLIGEKTFYSAPGFPLLLLLFSFIGTWAPTPTCPQYYYPVVILAALAVLRGLLVLEKPWLIRGLIILWAAVLLEAIPARSSYHSFSSLTRPETWEPVAVHRLGVQVRAAAGASRVLTLCPVIPLEGGASIYEAFATGPFAWRCSALARPEERERYKIISAAELPVLLEQAPPGAILTGIDPYDARHEAALTDYARSNQYRTVVLPNGSRLDLRP